MYCKSILTRLKLFEFQIFCFLFVFIQLIVVLTSLEIFSSFFKKYLKNQLHFHYLKAKRLFTFKDFLNIPDGTYDLVSGGFVSGFEGWLEPNPLTGLSKTKSFVSVSSKDDIVGIRIPFDKTTLESLAHFADCNLQTIIDNPRAESVLHGPYNLQISFNNQYLEFARVKFPLDEVDQTISGLYDLVAKFAPKYFYDTMGFI